jgi:hypothetical protein
MNKLKLLFIFLTFGVISCTLDSDVPIDLDTRRISIDINKSSSFIGDNSIINIYQYIENSDYQLIAITNAQKQTEDDEVMGIIRGDDTIIVNEDLTVFINDGFYVDNVGELYVNIDPNVDFHTDYNKPSYEPKKKYYLTGKTLVSSDEEIGYIKLVNEKYMYVEFRCPNGGLVNVNSGNFSNTNISTDFYPIKGSQNAFYAFIEQGGTFYVYSEAGASRGVNVKFEVNTVASYIVSIGGGNFIITKNI